MRHALSLLVAALAVAHGAVRQAPVQPAQQRPVFRTGVDYVTVDVVVTDTSDRPITNLTKTDFEIVESGKTQAIADFQFVSVPLEQRAIDLSEPRAPEPDVATNVPPTPTSRLFALVIDDLHIIESEIVPVKRIMTDFLRAISPNDEVAIVFVGRSDLSQNFTTNPGRMLKAIDRVRDAMGFGLDALARRPGDEARTEAESSLAGRVVGDALNYARSSADGLRNVAASLAASGHARRAIVYVSGQSVIPPATLEGQTYLEELQRAFDAARRSNVPIYTLDPRGLAMPETAVRGWGATSPEARALISANIRVQQNWLSVIAINTGGRAFTNNSNLTWAVNEIVGENGSYYLLGYYPNPLVHDGRFHDITVKVNRPGVRVRARQGYVAATSDPTAADVKHTLETAMGSGANVSGLSLRAFAAPIAASAKGMTAVVTIEVTYPVAADGSRQLDDALRLGIVAIDGDARIKASAERDLSFKATPKGPGEVTFLIDDVIDLPSQPLTLRVAVASRALGKAGMTHLELDVPKPAESALQLSGLVIGLLNSRRDPAMGADLIRNLVPFQPTTTRTFAVTDTLRVFARLFWGTPHTTPVSEQAAVDVTLTVRGEGTTAAQTTRLTSTAAPNGRREATLDTMLPLKDLAAGHYVLEVAARLPGGQAVRRDVAFEVR